MSLKRFGKVFTSKFAGTGPSSYKKRIYRAAVSQRLRNTGIERHARWTAVWVARKTRRVPERSTDVSLNLRCGFPLLCTAQTHGLLPA